RSTSGILFSLECERTCSGGLWPRKFAIRNPQSTIRNRSKGGHSSVGRAPALQAGSQGFESPCLQSRRRGGKIQQPGTISDALASVIPLPPAFAFGAERKKASAATPEQSVGGPF